MGFWVFMFLMDLLIPAIMIAFGLYFKDRAPKKIQNYFGYRTRMSKKSQDTWQFAHHYLGRAWWRWGIVLVPVTVIVMLFVWGEPIDTVGTVGGILCCVQAIPLLGACVATEVALRKRFDDEGRRRW